jgi:hypothetical protein
MSPALEKALRLVAVHGSRIEGNWWVIGSIAALLAGSSQFDPDDVDVFGNTETMNAFVKFFGCELSEAPDHHQFRSMPYRRIALPDSTLIEVMGGLEVLNNGQWQKLLITTRIEISGFGAPLWIPAAEEQIAIFEMFGRPKDLAKAAVLAALR